jgi:predicted nucleotidyltransferase component of viral defense system
MKGIMITESTPATQQTINKLILRTPDRIQIKIEVTPVLRGSVYDPKTMTICSKAEEQFGFAEISVLSFADLYAGKILATLDRQHPRDLFDVHQLLENEGINDEMRTAIVRKLEEVLWQ